VKFDTYQTNVTGAAVGTLRSNDPDRINLKKIVLTGFPVKVHKNKAVVRWMFNTPEDVLWFRPLDLWTKYGRRGRIRVRLYERALPLTKCKAIVCV